MAYAQERPVSAVLADIVGNVQEIVRSEVRLAKAEVKQETAQAAHSLGFMACGVGLAFYAFGLLLVAAIFLLAKFMDAWLAALVVCLIVAVVAVPLILAGRREWQRLRLTPERTLHSVKENVSWMSSPSK